MKYKDVFGLTLVTKHLGEQQYGTSCDHCYPAPFSRSDGSSANGTARLDDRLRSDGRGNRHTGKDQPLHRGDEMYAQIRAACIRLGND